ncbi:Protein of unknown function [Bacillus mycoides]|nr:Protein of unknown function [Bacillus mycoides]
MMYWNASPYAMIQDLYPDKFQEWEFANTRRNLWSIEKGIEVLKWVISENSINKEKNSKQNGTSNKIASSFASIQAVVNKEYGLPEDYMPEDLVVPNVPFSFSGTVEKSHLRKEAAEALEKLFLLAKQDGIQLNAVSGFRSYEYQKGLYANNQC